MRMRAYNNITVNFSVHTVTGNDCDDRRMDSVCFSTTVSGLNGNPNLLRKAAAYLSQQNVC